jgi:gluconokinase
MAAHHSQPVVVVMGVSGSGKTTVGTRLAELFGVTCADADAFHPPANIAKMSAGEPLDDADRAPWLDAIGAWAREHAGRGGGVVSCSALKRAYRDRLRAAAPGLVFVHLSGDRELIAGRMAARTDHFMPLALLDSQLATLEPLTADEPGAVIDIDAEPPAVAERAAEAVRRLSSSAAE